MKKVILTIVVLLTFSICASAQQKILFEEFTSPVGTLLTALGWSQSLTATANPLTITSPGLTFPGMKTQGNALTIQASGQDCYAAFTAQSTGSLYVSFLMQLSTAGSAGDYFIALSQSTAQTNYFARLYAKPSGTGFIIGITKNAEGYAFGTTVFNFNTTYLVVVKHTFNATATNDDLESVYVFSTALPAVEPTTGEIYNYVGSNKTDPADLGIVTLRQGMGSPLAPALIIDELMISNSWSTIITGVAKEEGTVPTDFSLNQNYPNPFNPTTQIAFSIPQTGNYALKIYDILGKEIETLVNNEQLSSGKYSVTFNAKNLASGTYIYRLTGNGVNMSNKMLLVK
jgi:hypothetical protein